MQYLVKGGAPTLSLRANRSECGNSRDYFVASLHVMTKMSVIDLAL